MKRTRLMATITQYTAGTEEHIDRRVYVEEETERLYVKINGEFFSLIYLSLNGRKVLCWRS